MTGSTPPTAAYPPYLDLTPAPCPRGYFYAGDIYDGRWGFFPELDHVIPLLEAVAYHLDVVAEAVSPVIESEEDLLRTRGAVYSWAYSEHPEVLAKVLAEEDPMNLYVDDFLLNARGTFAYGGSGGIYFDVQSPARVFLRDNRHLDLPEALSEHDSIRIVGHTSVYHESIGLMTAYFGGKLLCWDRYEGD